MGTQPINLSISYSLSSSHKSQNKVVIKKFQVSEQQGELTKANYPILRNCSPIHQDSGFDNKTVHCISGATWTTHMKVDFQSTGHKWVNQMNKKHAYSDRNEKRTPTKNDPIHPSSYTETKTARWTGVRPEIPSLTICACCPNTLQLPSDWNP